MLRDAPLLFLFYSFIQISFIMLFSEPFLPIFSFVSFFSHLVLDCFVVTLSYYLIKKLKKKSHIPSSPFIPFLFLCLLLLLFSPPWSAHLLCIYSHFSLQILCSLLSLFCFLSFFSFLLCLFFSQISLLHSHREQTYVGIKIQTHAHMHLLTHAHTCTQ